MDVRIITRAVVVLALLIGLGGCASMGKATSLYNQLGGMDTVRSLSDTFVNNAASDSRTSSMLSNANVGALKTQMSAQLCALIGGGCQAPLTDSQISAAAKKVDAKTSSALNDSFSKAFDAIKTTPGVKETVTKLVGPQLGGIVAGLL
jgi:hemoglobin